MPLNRQIYPGDNPDLTEERLRSTFDTDALAAVLKGGRRNLERTREIKAEIEKRPALSDPKPVGHMTREEKFENASRKTLEILNCMGDIVDVSNNYESQVLFETVMGEFGFPLALHFVMAIPTLQNQLDDEENDGEWLSKAMTGEMLATYAQTEMGHGTNLGKIETISTFDRATDEFVLHTPTQTAMKWWPGGLGNTVNHVLAMANLSIDGKSYGPHLFIVPIRDLTTHKALPGIKVGDIGGKMGLNGVDNGFLQFDHYRIPRRNMLMKFAKVDRNGVYHPPRHVKSTFSSMTLIRAEIVAWETAFLSLALTIAIRYSCVRRQGEITPGKGEVKVLDYQTQQNRLFPGLARVMAFHFTAEKIKERAAENVQLMKEHKISEEDMADLHAMSCALKAFSTFECSKAVDQCRMACGGHGYSEASYLPTLYCSVVAGCTYEGDNIVMLLQTARYLMKAAKAAIDRKSLAPSIAFLLEKDGRQSLLDRIPQGDYSHYLKDLEHVARKQIFYAYERMESLRAAGISDEMARVQNGVELIKASRIYARLCVARFFFDSVQNIADYHSRNVLDDLLHLHLNLELQSVSKYLLEDGYISSHQLSFIKEDIYRLYQKIRPNAVSIVDSFDYNDRQNHSALGKRDGHAYKHLYEWALQSPLNQYPDGVSPVFEKYILPINSQMTDVQSKL